MSKAKVAYVARKGNSARDASKVRKICSINNCGRIHFCKSYCTMHYQSVKHGYKIVESPVPRRYMSAFERVCEYVEIQDGCWDWQGSISLDGYGKIRFQDKHWRAHRLSYEAFIGKIPQGLTIDHLCENKLCVNPFHLEPISRGENVRRYHNNRRLYEEAKRKQDNS